jgi:acetyltransferase-like isoleucine patch superfamily enzyme
MLRKIIWVICSLHYKLLFNRFGLMSYITKPLYLSGCGNMSIGDKVRIFPHSRLECIGENSSLSIGDNVSIGPNLNITCAGETRIGNGVTISSNVFITDMDHGYKVINIPIMEQENIVKKTIIGSNSFIGTGAVILAGTKLGKQCIIGANTVVRGDYGDYSVLVGNPAKVIKQYNTETKFWEKSNG